VDRLSPARRSAQLRAQWRVSERQPALLFVGDLVPGHGVEALPALSDAVRGAGADHRLLVVGDGPLRRRLASDLPNAILFGALEREQLADIYASADVLIHPGESDLTGMVVLEAQASGLPVVASTRGAAREDLVPDASGILCADSDHWRAALVRLLGSAALRHQMGVAARRLALDRQWALTLDPLFSAYRLAAASTSPGGSPDLARPVS
jgi:glycosyltransferase involved in cell wall biosynthesis